MRGKVKFEYRTRPHFAACGEHLRHEIGEHSEKENDEDRNVHNDQQRRHDPEREQILPLVSDSFGKSSVFAGLVHNKQGVLSIGLIAGLFIYRSVALLSFRSIR